MTRHILFFLLILCTTLAAQEWKQFTVSNSGIPSNLVYDLAIAPDNSVWVATGNGIAAFSNGVWTVYDTTNSPLPDPFVTAIAVDPSGTVWMGTGFAGAARLSGGMWTVYDTANSDIPHNTIADITIGPDHTPWFATEDGLANFKDGHWSNLKNNMIEPQSRAVAFDRNGKLWMGTYTPVDFRGYIEYMKDGVFSHTILSHLSLFSTHARSILALNDSTVFVGTGNGLIRFMNGDWTVYHMQDSPLPANGVSALAQSGDTLIIATASGVAEKVKETWQVVFPSSGGLPNDAVTAIAVDRHGNRWYATMSSGIVVHKKGGIISSVAAGSPYPEQFALLQNYPNPFNPATTLQFTVPNGAAAQQILLTVFDQLGRRVAELMNSTREPGIHSVRWDASNQPAGLYFARLTAGTRSITRKLLLVK